MFDDAKQEFAYAYRSVAEWWYDDDNKTATLIIAVITAVIALFVYSGIYFGGRAAWRGLNEESVITVVNGNPCLTEKGLIKAYAPKECYFDKQSASERFGLMKPTTPTPPPEPKADVQFPYNPPCSLDVPLRVCGDTIYGKFLVEGIVESVEFHDDDLYTKNGHLQPDDTSVTVHTNHGGKTKVRFCGNLLSRLTPGGSIEMVVNDSEQSDYNGCYTIEPLVYTFKGEHYRK